VDEEQAGTGTLRFLKLAGTGEEMFTMKKQSDIHSPHRVRESETVATNLPAPAFTGSKPKGVQDRSHPGASDPRRR
jgi:hypothetical protein